MLDEMMIQMLQLVIDSPSPVFNFDIPTNDIPNQSTQVSDISYSATWGNNVAQVILWLSLHIHRHVLG